MTKRSMCALLALLTACDRSISDPPSMVENSLDIELCWVLGRWGALPIGPMPAQSPALVSLGQAPFFDTLLTCNRSVACSP